jgi:hypothetical protein
VTDHEEEMTEDQQREADEERYVHFSGEHVQDAPQHGEHCVDSCPYDTPEQARAREETRVYVEAREAEQAAEYAGMEAGR